MFMKGKRRRIKRKRVMDRVRAERMSGVTVTYLPRMNCFPDSANP